MKKIVYLFAIVFSLAAVSCSEENIENASNAVAITKADTEFDATGGTTSIQVTGTGVKAKADDEWLTVTVENTEVKLTAAPNEDLQSRHTMVTIFAEGADSVRVNVSQNGAFYRTDAPSNITVNTDEAKTVTYTVESSFPTTVKSLNKDWLSVTLEKEKLSIKLGENKTGSHRIGKFVLTNQGKNDTIRIVQYDVKKDILGKYEMYFKDEKNKAYKMPVTLTDKSIELNIDTLKFTIPARLVEDDGVKLEVQAGQYVGKYKDFFCYMIYLNDDGTKWTEYKTTYKGNLVFNITEDGISGAFDGTLNSFCIQGFDAEKLAEENDKGTLLAFLSPVFKPAKANPKAPTATSKLFRKP